MKRAALLAFAACVQVAPEYHCANEGDCVLDGMHGRCEPSGHCSMPDPDCGAMGSRYHESAGSQAGICVLSGGNDLVPAFDLKRATDSVHGSCAPAGARDVSFELTVAAPSLFLFDTATQATTAAVALSLYDGPCPAKEDRERVGQCSIHACGMITPPYDQLASPLGPGTYCLVVDEADPSAATGSVSLRATPAGRDARIAAPPAPVSWTTCGQQPAPGSATCGAGAPAPVAAIMVPMCPGAFHLTATATPSAPLDAALAVHTMAPDGTEVGCSSGAAGSAAETITNALVMGPGAVWLTVGEDVGTSTCGPFSVDTHLTPL